MKKLEDIPKKKIFDVPEGYFEDLPGKIQHRITGGRSEPEERPVFMLALRYALPAIVLAAGVFWFTSRPEESAETILASVQTEDLVAFLNDDDFTTDELLDDATLNRQDAEDIQDAVYGLGLGDNDFQDILDEID